LIEIDIHVLAIYQAALFFRLLIQLVCCN